MSSQRTSDAPGLLDVPTLPPASDAPSSLAMSSDTAKELQLLLLHLQIPFSNPCILLVNYFLSYFDATAISNFFRNNYKGML